jgi:hypothetical protein
MLTVADVRVKTTLEAVIALEDAQVQTLLNTASRLLKSYNLDPKASDYLSIFDEVHMMIFDWYASNPRFVKQLVQGGLSEQFSVTLPQPILDALRPIRRYGFGELQRDGGV